MIFSSITYTQQALISAPKIPTDFLWGLSLLFVIVALLYFVSTFFFRNRQSRLGKRIKAKRKVFSPMICEFLFFEEDGAKEEKINYIDLKIQIRELIKHPFDRTILTAVLLDLRKDVTGKTRTELLRVYQDLELHKDAYKKLKSWRWEIVSKGIYELTQMEVNDSYGLITRFINDKRATIRKQAEIATVSLKHEGINYFLDHTKYKISEWQQLKLLDVVRNKIDYDPPPFRLWLTSKNNHVVLFSLRLIKYYNQNDASASLIQLLRHKNNHIKKEAIFCIRDFNVVDAVPVLKTIFWKCTTDVKMFILEALSQLGTEDDIDFLEDLLTKEVAFTVKGKAISALNTIRPEGVMPSNDILPKEDFETVVPISDTTSASTKETELGDNEKSPISDHIPQTEMIQNFEKSQNSLEISTDEISFLPIVVEELITPVLISPEVSTKEEEQIQVRDLNVHYQEIFPSTTVENLHFQFLPIVVEESSLEVAAGPSVAGLPVICEEVVAVNSPKEERSKALDEPNDAPVVIFEEISVPKESENDTDILQDLKNEQKEISFSDNIAIESLAHLPVIYDTFNFEKLTSSKEFVQDIDWAKAFKTKKRKELDNHNDRNNIAYGIPGESWNIPKPLFYDDAVLNTIALLQDIAELGDHREIPLLNTLLHKETNLPVKNRIKELISLFSITENLSINFESTIQDERQSVFHSLFEVSDTEAKVILLGEISEVGDEMEIPLLKSLAQSAESQVQKAAKLALMKLSSRLLIKANNVLDLPLVTEETCSNVVSESDDMFTIEFDCDTSETATKISDGKTTSRNDGNTLFDHLCAMSTNLYNKE